MMDFDTLIRQLQDTGVTLTVDGPDLVLRPASRVPADLVTLLKERKPELMAYLSRPPVEVVADRCERCGSRLRREGVCVRCSEGGAEMPGPCSTCGGAAWVLDPHIVADGSVAWWRCDVCQSYEWGKHA